jgi:hypothetical protein
MTVDVDINIAFSITSSSSQLDVPEQRDASRCVFLKRG